VLSGEHDFDAFVAARSGPLFRTATLLTGGDTAAAADAVQNTMLELWRRWTRVRTMDRADGYAYRVLATQVLRGQRGALKLVPTETVPEQPIDDIATTAATRSDMWSVVRTLPSVQRAVVVLRFYEDMTEAQTADALDISIGTVKSHTSRALATLRRVLGEQLTAGGSHD
jgi:RNA polymerase sigma-70 factor (sigma-E family)